MAAAAATTQPPPHVIEECDSIVRLLSNGSIIRDPDPDFPPSIHDDGSVEWKDPPFGPPHLSLHLRLYSPKLLPSPAKLPVLFYFHVGGFCVGSRTWSIFHDCDLRLASSLPALVVSPGYRLTPEHRLPAAIHNAAAALDWLHSDPDPCLAQSADLSRVFVSGESAGANLALRSARMICNNSITYH